MTLREMRDLEVCENDKQLMVQGLDEVEGVLRSALTSVEVLRMVTDGDHTLMRLLPGLSSIEGRIKGMLS